MAYIPFPTGTILTFGGSVAPDGWLLCDGSTVSRTTYARLFAVLSTTYGSGDGATTFTLPDMRGVYPRGAGTNGTANYGGVTGHTPAGGVLATKGGQKTAKNGLTVSGGTASLGGNVSFTVGHTHSLSNNGGARVGFIGNTGAGFTDFYGDFNGPSASINKVGDNSGGSGNTATITRNSAGLTGSTDTKAADGTVSLSNTAASIGVGDTETTPAFLTVNYIIKL